MKISKKQLKVLIGAMLIQAIPYGLAQNVPPLFIGPIKNTFHFDLAGVNLIFTLGAIAAAISSPIAGKFFGKLPTRRIMFFSLSFAGIGMIIQMLAFTLPMFYIANAIIQIGCIIFSGLAVPYLIGSWFEKKIRPTAIGIAFAGGSIGNFFLQPFFSNLLTTHASENGLHYVFFVAAAMTIVSGWLITLFLIEDNNQKIDDNSDDQVVKLSGLGFQHTKSLAPFWLMGIGMLLVGLNIAAQSSQYAVYFGTDQINLKSIIGIVGSIFAIACLAGNVVGGVFYSKLGIYKAVFIGFILQLGSALCMYFLGIVQTPILAYLWALLYGLSVFIYTSGPSVIIQQLFGMRDFGQTVGFFNIFFAVGFALGTFIFGLIVDKFGFSIGWLSVVLYALIGFIIMLVNIKIVDKEKYDERFID